MYAPGLVRFNSYDQVVPDTVAAPINALLIQMATSSPLAKGARNVPCNVGVLSLVLAPLPKAKGVAPTVLSTAETMVSESAGRHVTVLEALLLTPETDSAAVMVPKLSGLVALTAVVVKPFITPADALEAVITVLLTNPLVTSASICADVLPDKLVDDM